jgi:D-3-phosphoglycerate dehydrogenase / 2-oxoglutarate reductase
VAYTIVVAAGTFGDVAVEQEAAGPRARVTLADLATPQDVAVGTAGADAVVVTNNPLSADHLRAFAATVRVIGRAGVGLDAIDLETAAAQRLAVYHLPDYATHEVATHAVALILASHRRLLEGDRVARTRWHDWRAIGEIAPIEEQTVGLIGCGRIGRAVARRLEPLAGRILVFDPYAEEIPAPAERAGTLEELLAQSDVVSLHLPWVPGDLPLLGRRELELLKPGAIVINVSRGGLIDQDALAELLAAGTVGGAGLDVLVEEPPPTGTPILSAPRTLLSPHVGWYSVAAEPRARRQVVEGVLTLLEGGRPPFGRIAVER